MTAADLTPLTCQQAAQHPRTGEGDRGETGEAMTSFCEQGASGKIGGALPRWRRVGSQRLHAYFGNQRLCAATTETKAGISRRRRTKPKAGPLDRRVILARGWPRGAFANLAEKSRSTLLANVRVPFWPAPAQSRFPSLLCPCFLPVILFRKEAVSFSQKSAAVPDAWR